MAANQFLESISIGLEHSNYKLLSEYQQFVKEMLSPCYDSVYNDMNLNILIKEYLIAAWLNTHNVHHQKLALQLSLQYEFVRKNGAKV
jgi:hypothetical protein